MTPRRARPAAGPCADGVVAVTPPPMPAAYAVTPTSADTADPLRRLAMLQLQMELRQRAVAAVTVVERLERAKAAAAAAEDYDEAKRVKLLLPDAKAAAEADGGLLGVADVCDGGTERMIELGIKPPQAYRILVHCRAVPREEVAPAVKGEQCRDDASRGSNELER
eukprot:gene27856-50652_t